MRIDELHLVVKEQGNYGGRKPGKLLFWYKEVKFRFNFKNSTFLNYSFRINFDPKN